MLAIGLVGTAHPRINLPTDSPSPHLPISPSPHLPISHTSLSTPDSRLPTPDSLKPYS
ncbi:MULTISPECIES: hypothetical protein [unclassified Moorena]|uniref:hypothetical protein n=1 Tax=unclassified Moorena TaxID=2683338 RepID=UPI0025FFC14E|nr:MULTISPECIES: hypothetical protein [unclassified Moorena]